MIVYNFNNYILPFMTVVSETTARLVNVYHPSLWANRSYPCCGSSQRSTSKATNGCRSVTWSPDSSKPMGINFSHIIHPSTGSASPSPVHGGPSSSSIPVPTSAAAKQPVPNGTELDVHAKAIAEGQVPIDVPSAPPAALLVGVTGTAVWHSII